MAEDKSNPMNPYTYLAGVVSFGPSQCGTKGFPGVYTVILSSTFPILFSSVRITHSFQFVFIFVHRESINMLTGF